MISIALYKPDIPQNTASILRLCACLGLKIHIIEPCGFNLNDSRFKRVIMDYINQSSIIKYNNFEELLIKNKKSRVILMSTKAKKSLFKFDAINMTLGLKYLRFSPDHGTAPDIILKNKANSYSLKKCIDTMIDLK